MDERTPEQIAEDKRFSELADWQKMQYLMEEDFG